MKRTFEFPCIENCVVNICIFPAIFELRNWIKIIPSRLPLLLKHCIRWKTHIRFMVWSLSSTNFWWENFFCTFIEPGTSILGLNNINKRKHRVSKLRLISYDYENIERELQMTYWTHNDRWFWSKMLNFFQNNKNQSFLI